MIETKINVIVAVGIGILLIGVSTLAGINPYLEEDTNIENTTQLASYKITYEPLSIKEEDSSTIITTPNSNIILNEGKPMLPYENKVFEFPVGTEIVDVKVTTSDIKTIPLSDSIPQCFKKTSSSIYGYPNALSFRITCSFSLWM